MRPGQHQTIRLTHWGQVTHICVSKQTTIVSDNGLSPSLRQAIICTNVGISLIQTLATNFNEILSEIHKFSFRKIHFKMSSGKWQPSCLGLNVLNPWPLGDVAVVLKALYSNSVYRIQSSTVVTRSNLLWYFIQHPHNSGRKWIRF